MRQLLCWTVLLVCLPLRAENAKPYQEWLDFKQAFAEDVGGPSGIYAIQDMLELSAGETAYLPSGGADALRWSKTSPAVPVAQVEFKDKRGTLRGPGIKERDLLSASEAVALPNGLTVRATLMRGSILKLWLYNAKLPAQRGFKGLDYFPYDARGVITGVFRRNQQPVPVSYLDSRDQAGTMYVVGTLQAQIGGKMHDLKTYSYRNNWNEIDAVLLLLRDRTSGKTTYGGGRVVDIRLAKGAPPQVITFNLNSAYSFLCAHSDYFNCPLVLTNNLDVELKFGEKYPPLMADARTSRN
jgi:uncharacterized protein